MPSRPMADPFEYYNPFRDVDRWENRLPHWQLEGAAYFVTFRLNDSLPAVFVRALENEKQAWQANHPGPWSAATELDYHKRFSARVDQVLDHGDGSCLLEERRNADVVAGVLGFYEGVRVLQLSWVVMPNHVHALFVLLPKVDLSDLIMSWKSFSARRINEHARRHGELWQAGYFDRVMRDRVHFMRTVRYIRNNPAKARLAPGRFVLWESPLALAVD